MRCIHRAMIAQRLPRAAVRYATRHLLLDEPSAPVDGVEVLGAMGC
jgi:hypothetical protein